MRTIGVIGGSGLYDLPGLSKVREVRVRTPFGDPSDAFVTGVLEGVKLVFLPRHGRGHRLLPTEINTRANVWGFKKLGVEQLISFSAVGSMREDIAPGHLVIVDQLIDWTRSRALTFFGDGVVAHVPFADPFCPELAGVLLESSRAANATVHQGGTYLCIEGPHFSTRAESQLYRSWGVDVIGMTNATEARLAREAELCFATVALATDYDCWHQTEADVTAEAVTSVMAGNVSTAREVVRLAAARLGEAPGCACGGALRGAIMTAPEVMPASTRRRLAPLIDRHLAKPPPVRRKSARPASKTKARTRR